MISRVKVMKIDVPAREWSYDLLTRPNMRIKTGGNKPCRISEWRLFWLSVNT